MSYLQWLTSRLNAGSLIEDFLKNTLKRESRSGDWSDRAMGCSKRFCSGLVHPLSALVTRVMPVFVAVSFLLPFFVPASVAAASSTHSQKARLQVSAKVLPFVTLRVDNRLQMLEVTEEDIARGYVDLAQVTSLQVRTNSRKGCSLQFENYDSAISRVEVHGLNRPVTFQGSGAVEPLAMDAMETNLRLSYRFTFSEKVRAGVYPWPLTVAIL